MLSLSCSTTFFTHFGQWLDQQPSSNQGGLGNIFSGRPWSSSSSEQGGLGPYLPNIFYRLEAKMKLFRLPYLNKCVLKWIIILEWRPWTRNISFLANSYSGIFIIVFITFLGTPTQLFWLSNISIFNDRFCFVPKNVWVFI